MAILPWKKDAMVHRKDAVSARSAVVHAYEKGADVNMMPTVTEDPKKFLLGQTARAVA